MAASRFIPFNYVKVTGLTPGITRRPERLFEFESRCVGGRVHAIVRCAVGVVA
jgi:hypothetical protein